jgi:hypothetical protein
MTRRYVDVVNPQGVALRVPLSTGDSDGHLYPLVAPDIGVFYVVSDRAGERSIYAVNLRSGAAARFDIPHDLLFSGEVGASWDIEPSWVGVVSQVAE